MKLQVITLLTSFVFIVGAIGCASINPQTIDPVDAYSNHSQDREELMIPSDSGTIAIPIEQIPALHTYLEEYPSHTSDRKTEIDRIIVNPLPNPADTYAVISYGCGIKLCDHVLVRYSDNQTNSFPLPESSIFQEALFTMDNKYLAIKLGRNEGASVTRSSLVIINTVEFTHATLQNNTELTNRLTNENFTVPIHGLHWENVTTLQFTIPDINDYSFESLQQWQQQERKTKNVKLLAK